MTNIAKKQKEDIPVYKFSLVLPQHLTRVWEDVSKILDKSVKRSGNRVRQVDVYHRLAQNLASLWIIFDEDTMDIVGCVVTNLHDYPTGLRMLHIEHIAGKHMDQWVEEGFNTMYKWAKDNSCQGVEGIGRAGFFNWAKKKGWKESSRFFEVMFDEGDNQ
jgi:hypothetical protein